MARAVWHEAARNAGVPVPITSWAQAKRIAHHIEQTAEIVKSAVARPLRAEATLHHALQAVTAAQN